MIHFFSRLRRIIFFSLLFFLLLFLDFCIGFWVQKKQRQRQFFHNVMNQLELIASISPESSKSQKELMDEFKTSDIRIVNLKYFFRKYNSVLYEKAEYVVKAADTYGLDYRLLPAIAMQESNLCKYIYQNSHNCWGWGIYGGKVTRFSSYEEAIDTISRGIKTQYIDKGLKTPEEIMSKYTPPSDGSWAHGVNTFLNIIE